MNWFVWMVDIHVCTCQSASTYVSHSLVLDDQPKRWEHVLSAERKNGFRDGNSKFPYTNHTFRPCHIPSILNVQVVHPRLKILGAIRGVARG